MKDADKPSQRLGFRPWGARRGWFQSHVSTNLLFRYRSVDGAVFQGYLIKPSKIPRRVLLTKSTSYDNHPPYIVKIPNKAKS